MTNNKHLHGRSFAAEIATTDCTGRISVSPVTGFVYLCQNEVDGSDALHVERFGYRYAWFVGDELDFATNDGVQRFKLLPPAEEYHELFVELLAARMGTWDEDGSYSVVPKELVGKVVAFLDNIKNQSKC